MQDEKSKKIEEDKEKSKIKGGETEQENLQQQDSTRPSGIPNEPR